MQNAIKQHEQNLIQLLQHAENNLAENIQIEQAKLIKNTVRNVSFAEPNRLDDISLDSHISR
ncbi:MbeB family mobilization protein [Pasteurella multocida]|uniref:MbeB family mobilization protein n=1 Tax=Pasteurella multocida TaxID=747 RepID=UPI0015F13431